MIPPTRWRRWTRSATSWLSSKGLYDETLTYSIWFWFNICCKVIHLYMYTAKQFLISFSSQVKDYWQLLQCRPKKSWVTNRQIHVQMQAKPANHSAFWALLPISCICSCLANHENHPILSSICLSVGSKFVGWVWRLVGALEWLLKSIDLPFLPLKWIPSRALTGKPSEFLHLSLCTSKPLSETLWKTCVVVSVSRVPEKLSCWNIYFWKEISFINASSFHLAVV